MKEGLSRIASVCLQQRQSHLPMHYSSSTFCFSPNELCVQVLANDLNPISYKYLQQNIILNKVQRNVTAFNMDGRAFIRQQCNLAEAAAAAEVQPRCGMYSARQVVACIVKHKSFIGSFHDSSFCIQQQLNV